MNHRLPSRLAPRSRPAQAALRAWPALLLLLTLLISPASSPAAQGQGGQPAQGVQTAGSGPLELKAGILDYGRSTPELMRWMDERILLKVGGDKPGRPGMHWMTYFNVQGVGSPADLLKMNDFARAKGVAPDDMLLHATKNHTSKVNPAYRGMDRFDVFEGKNGVLVGEGQRLEDRTASAYNGPTRLGREVYLGYEEPFAEINWKLSRPNAQTVAAEYPGPGGWRRLTLRDDTGGLARDGRMSFTPPGDWKRTSVNNSRQKYFIRLRLDRGTDVVAQRIYGEAWTNGAENACRGWDPAQHGIVNAGELAFNPEPPAHASARFRYQSRIPFWGANACVANIRAQKGEETLWAAYAAQGILDKAKDGQTGIMRDDARARPTLDMASTDFGGDTAAWDKAMIESNREITKRVHAARPGFEVGSNVALREVLFEGDWGLIEYHSAAWQTGSPRGITSGDGGTLAACYDDFAPARNPRKVFGLLMYADSSDAVPARNTPWDRANRGPMAALSKHYIGMNEYTFFSYHSKGGYIYDERDDVVLKNGKVAHMSRDPIPRVEDVKRWGQWFPAMAVPLGGPDPKGHKGGAYDLDFKSAEEMGERSPMWRRDYVNAIVLHRPAYYNTTAQAYEHPGPEIDLGGTFHPLRADGSTGPPVSRIALRPAEGAVLMRHPTSLGGAPGSGK